MVKTKKLFKRGKKTKKRLGNSKIQITKKKRKNLNKYKIYKGGSILSELLLILEMGSISIHGSLVFILLFSLPPQKNTYTQTA